MKSSIATILLFCLFLCVLVGCSKEMENSSSEAPKEEVELVLEQTLWKLDGTSAFLLFHDGKRVSEYDLSLMDEVNQDIEKSLSYSVETDQNNNKTIVFPYLLEKQDFRLTYQEESKGFIDAKNNEISLKQVPMKSFVEDFMKQIENAGKDKNWETQAEMNIASAIRCSYWDALYQAIDRYLKATLDEDDYQDFKTQTKTFEAARQTAMDEAGKEVEGGSLYPVVTGGAYCTETQKEIQNILTKYFA